MKGQVFRVISGFYDIFYKDKIYRVKGSGNLRNESRNPVVGDFVEFEINKFVTDIYDSRNKLLRPKVANIDQAAIVTSLKEPNYSSLLLNKFLSIVEFQNIKPIIIFTKIDLTTERYSEEYKKDGYKVFEIDNITKKNINKLEKVFTDKLTVFTGQTGVGKSSTINNITDIERKTQKISKALGRGKHTTRVVEILSFKNGLYIDTPGFSSLNINLSKVELASSYKDFKENLHKCKFRDCLHNKEINCEIKRMVEKGNISKIRYNDYILLLKEIDNG